jgi:hypothetical protein
MFAHLVVFIGIDYFDQSQYAWITLLVMISMTVSQVKSPKTYPVYDMHELELAGATRTPLGW